MGGGQSYDGAVSFKYVKPLQSKTEIAPMRQHVVVAMGFKSL